MKFVHVHPGSEELGRVYHPTSGDQCVADRLLRAALEGLQPPNEIVLAR